MQEKYGASTANESDTYLPLYGMQHQVSCLQHVTNGTLLSIEDYIKGTLLSIGEVLRYVT